MRVHDAQTGGHGWAGLTELQGVTIDFWGGPQLHLWAYQQILARKQKERETRAAGLMSAAYVHCWRRCSSLAARAANLAEKGWKLMWT